MDSDLNLGRTHLGSLPLPGKLKNSVHRIHPRPNKSEFLGLGRALAGVFSQPPEVCLGLKTATVELAQSCRS